MPTQEAADTLDRRAMLLQDLLARAVPEPEINLPAHGRNIRVNQITDDSRKIEPGACFVAVRGTHHDGSVFVQQAIERGAVAVVSDTDLSKAAKQAAFVRVPDARQALARMSAVYEGLADINWIGGNGSKVRKLRTVAVTGTNGKSTTCFLAQAVLQSAGHPCALLGTVEYDLLSHKIEAPMTTPPATLLIQYLVQAAKAGATHAVMEASSHALDQRRTDGVQFDVGIFTNLTGDHLDYHKTPEIYRLAKRRLFDLLDKDATAIVNLDDPVGASMLEACRARAIRFGFSNQADLVARIHSINARGSNFEMRYEGECIPVNLKLVGRHNVQNALCAAAASRALGLEWSQIVKGLESVTSVRGRLEAVRMPNGSEPPFAVLVDYAHTDDALQNVLSALRPLAPKKLIVMFGCGGDRDNTKRPRMAAVTAQWADRIIVTSDNPRSESPADIIEQVLEGFPVSARSQVLVQADRRKAIEEAIRAAEEGDVVVLAGKGHETYQEANGTRIHFDDVEIAAEMLARRYGRPSDSLRKKEA